MPSCRIIVPIYRPLSAAEYAVVKHNLAMLQDFPVALIGGQGQSALLAETRDELAAKSGSNVTVETFEDRFFQNVAGYNQLLTEPAFYQRFAVEDYVLICQQDAIVLKPELQDWLEKGYAFVGAPMFVGYHAPKRPLQFLHSLNGGLSLRHIPSALSVFRNVVFLRRSFGVDLAQSLGLLRIANWVTSLFSDRKLMVERDDLNEDVFWSRDIAALFPAYTVPPPETAAGFAFEVCPADLFERTGGLPFGCHAFERYDPMFWIEHAPSEVVPIVRALLPDSAADGVSSS